MSKPLSRRLRDFFTGLPNIYSASPDSGAHTTIFIDRWRSIIHRRQAVVSSLGLPRGSNVANLDGLGQ
jgi:hypothetical protein